jgi:hypothetical protein
MAIPQSAVIIAVTKRYSSGPLHSSRIFQKTSTRQKYLSARL